MRLYERLPDSVTVRGKKIRCDFDFRNVLRMLRVLSRDDLTEEARIALAAGCITKRPGRRAAGIIAAAGKLLFGKTEKGAKTHQRITDFDQDADYIRAAFLAEYRINLFRDRLHWCEFSSLLACLPEGSRYSEILGIRSRPMPKPTKYNQEERRWLAKAKADFAIRLTDREREEKLKENLRSVAVSLLALAGSGGEKNG
jgi:hypothetical protein